jgi:ferredoxin-NADP reductase
MDDHLAKFEFSAIDGTDLPPFEAGAHIDVIIAPEYQRQYSLAGDPADRSKYVLGVLREVPGQGGRGGSALMHRAFREGRRVFIGAPTNHFPLHEGATYSLLFAGGIGVTPMIAMAHRLHALRRPFELHYSAANRKAAGFVAELERMPWSHRVQFHFKDEGRRADLAAHIPAYSDGLHLYTCGSPRYMDAVFDTAAARAWPEGALHREYFTVPESSAWANAPFNLKLSKSKRILTVPSDRKATEVLAEAGISIDVKCSDGLCGVCASTYDGSASDEIEHRDFVLSLADRQQRVILCCSRAKNEGGTIVLDL